MMWQCVAMLFATAIGSNASDLFDAEPLLSRLTKLELAMSKGVHVVWVDRSTATDAFLNQVAAESKRQIDDVKSQFNVERQGECKYSDSNRYWIRLVTKFTLPRQPQERILTCFGGNAMTITRNLTKNGLNVPNVMVNEDHASILDSSLTWRGQIGLSGSRFPGFIKQLRDAVAQKTLTMSLVDSHTVALHLPATRSGTTDYRTTLRVNSDTSEIKSIAREYRLSGQTKWIANQTSTFADYKNFPGTEVFYPSLIDSETFNSSGVKTFMGEMRITVAEPDQSPDNVFSYQIEDGSMVTDAKTRSATVHGNGPSKRVAEHVKQQVQQSKELLASLPNPESTPPATPGMPYWAIGLIFVGLTSIGGAVVLRLKSFVNGKSRRLG